jgi:hypothetical protein
MPVATKPAWGNPQRFLVAGVVLFVLAAIAADILYRQFPSLYPGLRSPQAEEQYVKSLSTLETMKYFRMQILPGIEIYQPAEIQNKRARVYLLMAAVAGLGAIGLILATVGVVGIVRRR